ncbi:MAG TPA: putative metal-binding motif-containing protein [Myxococcota bacterium]|nr:putative metal-binding motif-containing protein [Myxococcota bacterium]
MLLLLLAGCPKPPDDRPSDSETDPCTTSWYPDDDGDGYGAGAAVEACEAPADHVETDGDCAETDETRHPGAQEQCDGVDQDCDGSIDEGLATTTWYWDGDLDGYGGDEASLQDCADPGEGWTAVDGDCNDADDTVNPGAEELCADGKDNDCDGLSDCEDGICEGCSETDCFDDVDNDGDGDTDCFDDECFGDQGCYVAMKSRVTGGLSAEVNLYNYLRGFYSPSGSRIVTVSTPSYTWNRGQVRGTVQFQLIDWTTTCSWTARIQQTYHLQTQVVGACPLSVSSGLFAVGDWLPEHRWTDSAFRLTDYAPWIHGPFTASQQFTYTRLSAPSTNYFRGTRRQYYGLSSIQPGSTFTRYP